MSFSTELKEEISKSENLANKKSVKYELLGYLLTTHTNIEKKIIKFTTENEYNINRFSRLLSNLQIENYNITSLLSPYVDKKHKGKNKHWLE